MAVWVWVLGGDGWAGVSQGDPTTVLQPRRPHLKIDPASWTQCMQSGVYSVGTCWCLACVRCLQMAPMRMAPSVNMTKNVGTTSVESKCCIA